MCVVWETGLLNIYIEYTGAALKCGDISIEMIIGDFDKGFVLGNIGGL